MAVFIFSLLLSACNEVEGVENGERVDINKEVYTSQGFWVTTELEFLEELTYNPEKLSLEEREERIKSTLIEYDGHYGGLSENSKIRILYIEDDYYAKIIILEPANSHEWIENNKNKEVWTLKSSVFMLLDDVEE